ncbi:MAG: hypothetical protein JKX92_03565 [Porticoccaceae bacterium]|nr:hypothetical protein [Porticoccaceae bacterium]
MKNLVIIITLILFSVTASADGSKSFAKEARKNFGLDNFKSKHLKDMNFKVATATIYTILENTQEFSIHQMDGATENKTFLHKDGHREAVFDKDGNAVEGCPNKATYNYYHPFQTPLGHFTADILPWLLMGSCRYDSSTLDQRVDAYVLDFRAGFERNLNNGNGFYLPEKFRFKKFGQSEAVSFFLKALDESGYDIENFSPKNINSKDEQERFFKAIELGFKKLLKNA